MSKDPLRNHRSATMDPDTHPGGAPSAGQAPGSATDSSLTTGADPNTSGTDSTQVTKLRAESARYRTGLRAAEAKIADFETRFAALESDKRTAEQTRLADQEQWKQLAETRSGELTTASTTHDAYKSSAERHLIHGHLRALLAAKGVKGEKTMAMLVRGVLEDETVKAKVDKDFKVRGEFAPVIDSLLGELGIKPPDADDSAAGGTTSGAAPSFGLAAMVSGQLPTSRSSTTTGQPQMDASERFRQNLERRLRAGK